MELQFVKVSPNENMTLLIESPVPRSQHLAVAKALIAYGSVYAEQAGYIEEPENKAACARLQMMAGEFPFSGGISVLQGASPNRRRKKLSLRSIRRRQPHRLPYEKRS